MIPRIDTIDGTCSLSNLPLGFVRETLRKEDDSYFYIVVHESFSKDKSWLGNYGIEDTERVELIGLPMDEVPKPNRVSYQRRLEYCVGPALGNKIRPYDPPGRYADVVLTECFQSIPFCKSILAGFFSRTYNPDIPFFAWSHWHPVYKWLRYGDALMNDYDHVASQHGLLYCDGTIFGSESQKEETLNDLKKMFNFSALKNMSNNSLTEVCGIDVDSIPYRKRDYDKPVALWTGYSTQDFYPCGEALVKAGMLGHYSKVILQFMGAKMGTKIPPEVEEYKKLDFVEVRGLMPHDEFLTMLTEADVIMYLDSGSWGIRIAEAMAAGCVPIVTERTAKNLCMKDYPFVSTLGNAKKHAIAIGKHLSTDGKKLDYHGTMREIAKTKFDVKIQSSKIYDYIKNHFKDKCLTNFKGGDMEDTVVKAASSFPDPTQESIKEYVGKGYFGGNKEGLFSDRFIRWSLLKAGFKDVGKSIPTYRKK